MPSRSKVFPSVLEFLLVGWIKLMVTFLVWMLHGMAISCFAMALCLSILIGQAKAGEVGCINAKVMSGKLITDLCWDCVFPIRVAGVPISGSLNASRVPDGAAKNLACVCWDNKGVPRPGIPTAFWQPNRLVEFQRVSGCSSVLNGIRFPFNRLNQGTQNKGQSKPAIDATYRHYHYYAFPVMIMLDMFVPGHCNPGAFHDLDVMYLSEVDPTWSSDELAFFTNPEAALLGTPFAVAACIPDAIAANIKECLDATGFSRPRPPCRCARSPLSTAEGLNGERLDEMRSVAARSP